MYDWANSAFMATVVTAVFPIYFASVAAADLDPATASFRFAVTTFVALSVVAVLAPVLGAIADFAGVKKKMLGAFLALGVVATACMFFIERGDWLLAVVLFVVANIGVTTSFVFYDSLLPHIASAEEMDRVSTAGYALGYLGGGLLLAVNLAWIQRPDLFGLGGSELASRLSFLSVAIWWLGFSIPLFRTVPEPALAFEPDEQAGQQTIRAAFVRLRATLRELRGYRQAFLMLLAFLVYNDGIGTIIRMATTFGTEIGLEQGNLITGDHAGAVHRYPVRIPVRADRRVDGGEARHFPGAGGLRRHQRPVLSDDHGHRVLRPGAAGRHGARRQPGAEPVVVRQHGAATQVVGVSSGSSGCSRSSPVSWGRVSSP